MSKPQSLRQRLELPVIAVVGLLAAGLAVLDVREQLFGIVPYALLLACPALHLVIRHGRRSRRRTPSG